MWVQQGSPINGTAAGDGFGSSVAVSGDGTIFIAGERTLDSELNVSDDVRVYAWDGAAWLQVGDMLVGSSGDRFRSSVAMSTDGVRIAVGAPQLGADAAGSGYVRVFDFLTSTGLVVRDGGGADAILALLALLCWSASAATAASMSRRRARWRT